MNTTTTTPEGAGEFPPLKPCPFCGHVGLDFREGSTFRWLDSSCGGCGASTGETRIQTLGQGTKEEWMSDAKRDAIAAWNRRAQAAEGGKEKAARTDTSLLDIHRAVGAYGNARACSAMDTATLKAELMCLIATAIAATPEAAEGEPSAPEAAEPAYITAMIDARRQRYALDQSCTPAFLHWLDTVAPREGVAANEVWNAGVEWQKTQSTEAAPAPASEAVAWFIDTHGVQSVALKKEDLGLLANRYARPLVFGDATSQHAAPSQPPAKVEREGLTGDGNA